MSCMNDPVGSSSVSDDMHARTADYGHVKILSAFSESRPSLGALLPAAPNIIAQDTRRIVDHVFTCLYADNTTGR